MPCRYLSDPVGTMEGKMDLQADSVGTNHPPDSLSSKKPAPVCCHAASHSCPKLRKPCDLISGLRGGGDCIPHVQDAAYSKGTSHASRTCSSYHMPISERKHTRHLETALRVSGLANQGLMPIRWTTNRTKQHSGNPRCMFNGQLVHR